MVMTLKEVQRKFDAGDLTSALKILNEVLILDKNSAEAHAKMGVIQVRMGRFHEGVEHLKKALALSPEKIKYHRSLAQSYEFRSHYDNAIRSYKAVSELASAGSDDYNDAIKKIDFLEATKLARGGQVEEALAMFSRLVEEHPDDYLIRYSLGLSYYFLRKMDKALVEFEKVVKLNPNYPNAYLNMATIYESKGNAVLAIESLEKIIEINSESGIAKKAQERLGIIEGGLIAASGNHQDALDILSEVIKSNPKNMPALLLMAKSYLQLEEVEFAIDSYKKILLIAPKHLEIKLQLAGLYMMTKRHGLAVDLLEQLVVEGEGTKYSEQAEKTLARISGESDTAYKKLSEEEKKEIFEVFLLDKIKRNPNDVESHFKLAQLYMREKRKEEAYRSISKAAELNPSNPQVIRVHASIANDLGKLDVAIEAFSVAIMLEVDAEKAAVIVDALRLAVAKKSFNDGQLGIAEAEFKAIIEDKPDSMLAYYYLGLIYGREEEFLRAVDAYENVIRISPGNFGARLNLAGSLERINREEDAISEYRKILQGKPNEEMAGSVKARLFATEKRIKGLSTSMSYSMAYTDSVNDDDTNRDDDVELRSDMSFNLSYQYKMRNGVRLRLSSAPSYSTYHKGQFDFLNSSNSLSATVSPGRYTLVGGYTNRRSKGLLTELRSSSSDVFFSEVMRRAKFRQIYKLFSEDAVMTGFTFNLSQTTLVTESSTFFNASTLRLGGDIEQNIDARTTIKLGYSHIRNDNTDVEGSDYAYRSHQLNLRFEHRFLNSITGNLGYGYTITRYLNRDSSTGFSQFRKNGTHNFSAGLAYWVSRKIRLFANYDYVKKSSNLAVKSTLTREEFEEGQRFQSASLGGAEAHSLTSGLNLLF